MTSARSSAPFMRGMRMSGDDDVEWFFAEQAEGRLGAFHERHLPLRAHGAEHFAPGLAGSWVVINKKEALFHVYEAAEPLLFLPCGSRMTKVVPWPVTVSKKISP